MLGEQHSIGLPGQLFCTLQVSEISIGTNSSENKSSVAGLMSILHQGSQLAAMRHAERLRMDRASSYGFGRAMATPLRTRAGHLSPRAGSGPARGEEGNVAIGFDRVCGIVGRSICHVHVGELPRAGFLFVRRQRLRPRRIAGVHSAPFTLRCVPVLAHRLPSPAHAVEVVSCCDGAQRVHKLEAAIRARHGRRDSLAGFWHQRPDRIPGRHNRSRNLCAVEGQDDTV